jgi:23S rRNA pseudouridine2605 synthase
MGQPMNEPAPPGSERLQKLLAAAGLGSRRGIEEWIRAGRVTVNGKAAQLGDRASPGDVICVDGKAVAAHAAAAPEHALLLYHKPVGEVTTRSDPENRPTVFERLPPAPGGRWINVGRLDVNTSGLLMFTTDGELAHRLMHPSSEIEREYLVRLFDEPEEVTLEQLRRGVLLEDGPAAFDRIEPQRSSDGSTSYRVVLREGRNREVRRLWQAVGHEVSRLQRTRYGSIALPFDLRPGQSRLAAAPQIAALREAARPPARKAWP